MFRNMVLALATGGALLAPSTVAPQVENKAQAAPVSGAKYFSTYKQAASFARSISGGYYTSITRSSKLYRVDYWQKGSHG